MVDIKNTIIKKIEQYDNIAIFFHEQPDLDALGSSYGLQFFIKTKYPHKDVRLIGLDILPNKFANNLFYFDKNHVENEFLSNSLGIILDTSSNARIWSQRQNYCRELLRIDHHPKTEVVADYEWVDATYSATAEMVAELLFNWDEQSILMPTCTYLYAGLLTDTNRFLYPIVSPRTYMIASKLVDKGANRQKVHDAIYLKEPNELLFRSYVLSKAHIDQDLGMAWAKLPKNCYDHYGVEIRLSMVHVLANITRIRIWFTFYYDDVAKTWKGSIRSTGLPVNNLAEKYRGGGHKLAAGMTFKNEKEMERFVKDVKKYLKQNPVKS